jgi:hypothetical protein
MNINRLYEILNDSTVQLRKEDAVVERQAGPLRVVEINNMPHIDEIFANGHLIKIDLELVVIGVDRVQAERHKDELIEILKTYPEPARLAGGLSYLEVGGVLGDQGMALQLFALGAALKLWEVITPTALGIDEPINAHNLAGAGYVMITGFPHAAT